MDIPILEEKVREQVNQLEERELIRTDSTWSLFRYGITGLVHAVIFADARKVSSEEISFEDFIVKYKPTLKTFPRGMGHVQIPLSCLESQGIFIPKAVYDIVHGGDSRFQEGVELFDPDYINLNVALQLSKEGSRSGELLKKIVDSGETDSYLSAFHLVDDNRKKLWQPEDLVDREVAEKGFNLGRYMWQISVAQYFDFESVEPERGRSVKPQITSLCRQLIPYYEGIIKSLENEV